MRKEIKIKMGDLFRELLILGGAGMVWYGLYMIYEPVSYIVLGSGLMWFAYPKAVN